MLFSIIIPVYNAAESLPVLLQSLNKQEVEGSYEVIVIDDCSTDRSYDVALEFDANVLRSEVNSGPAVCRNIGAKAAKGDVLVFTDSDCRVGETWLYNIEKQFLHNASHAIMGKLVLPHSTYLGDSISALGFPAGGSIGFEKIWRVDEDGYTDSLSTCNCAIYTKAFNSIGGFDETFPYPGGEDTLLAVQLTGSGYKIRYCPDVIVYHAARANLADFMKWQYRRGISSNIFAEKITNKGSFIALRLWSIKNILRKNIFDKKLPLIVLLLFGGYSAQIVGYISNKMNTTLRGRKSASLNC